jgi:hypothetical protein
MPYHKRMRRYLIRSVLTVLAVAVLAVAWIAAGPWWSRALDAIHTTRLATTTSVSIRQFSGSFRFVPGPDGVPLPEAEGFMSYDWGTPLENVSIQLDPGGVLLLIDGVRRFVLGKCPGAKSDHGYTPPIAPEPGDTISITLDRSMASWPTPFHVTCCGSLDGGGSWYPWARFLYWHLSWIKADGAICLPVSSKSMRAEAAGTNPARRACCASISGRRTETAVRVGKRRADAIRFHVQPPAHSHSIVPGGLLVTSYTTRLMPFTSLMMRVATRARKACSKG